MNVASLELCKELYKLSGWEVHTLKWVIKDNGAGDLTMGTIHASHQEYTEVIKYADEVCPAYELGYLLRKLQSHIEALRPDTVQDAWVAEYVFENQKPDVRGTTPEDAVCKLAIELFKQGVLV